MGVAETPGVSRVGLIKGSDGVGVWWYGGTLLEGDCRSLLSGYQLCLQGLELVGKRTGNQDRGQCSFEHVFNRFLIWQITIA